jgi:hypothetical protein
MEVNQPLPADGAEIPQDESSEPIGIRKLNRLETTYLSQGASN